MVISRVSILVLVECPSESGGDGENADIIIGFNPCSGGMSF